jgi:hypothetical protein
MGLQRIGGIGMQRERFSRRRDEPLLSKNTAASSSSNTTSQGKTDRWGSCGGGKEL